MVTAFSFISLISSGLILFAVPIYLKTELNLDIGKISLILSAYPIMRILGNIFGGFLTDKFGRKNILFIFIGISIFFSSSLFLCNDWISLLIIYSIIGFLYGGYDVVTLALFMDVTNPKIGATQFSIFTSISNTGELGTSTISGSLINMIGFSGLFLFSGWFFGPVLLILYFIKSK